ncbi:hypothetical protein ACFSE1_01125 [Rhizobium helianthi]|uniref:MerR family transcriptional regulator n=1 Tax=Rhizobium helianthi TaxID=1132695 RepID=A0ABW4LXY8_9HYPH
MAWTSRDFSVAEAAQCVGLHRTHLDVIISRANPLATLFSEKRKGRRWFSVRDITVLRIAYELERAGRAWNTAIAQAFEHTGTQPPPDALLVVPVASVSATSGRVLTGLPDPLPSSSFITVPIGRIAAEIMEAIDALAIQ